MGMFVLTCLKVSSHCCSQGVGSPPTRFAFLQPLLRRCSMALARLSGVWISPFSYHCDMLQFWQWRHRSVQPRVNMVPDGTSSGSSPMCWKIVDTVICVPQLQYPSSPWWRFLWHWRVQRWQLSSMRFAISIFRSRYDCSGVGKSSRVFWRVSIWFWRVLNSSVSLSWSCHSSSSGSCGLWFAGSFLAIMNLAGLSSCMTSKYLARLFRACLSLRTVVASGLRSVHIFL